MNHSQPKASPAVTDGMIYTCLLAVSLLIVLPVVWVVSTSFKPQSEIFAIPANLFPRRWTGENYAAVFQGGIFGRYLLNSLITALGSTVLGLVLGVPAAYGFAKYRYRFSSALLGFVVITRLFPPIALALPYFLQLRAVNLIDTRPGLIIAYIPIVLPLIVWILEGFFRDYPNEILEAARIDGAGVFRTLMHVVVPTSLPALSVATLFGFLVAWNEFVLALTVTRTPAAQTMPVGIASLITQFQTYWGQMMAVASVYLVPVLVLTVITQRGIVGGLVSGATKG